MKHLLISALMLFLVVCSFGQEGKKSKEFPRFQKEELKTNRNNATEAFKKNLEMKADDELKLMKSEKDQLDFTHDKYQQYYKKVKVEGAVYSVHSRNNVIESYSGEFKGITNFDVTPDISESQGLQAAINHVGATVYAWDKSVKEGYPDYKYPTGELVIIGGAPDDELDLTLAWKYDIYAAEPLYRAEVFINAKTGEFVKENQLIHNANTDSSGLTLYNGLQSFKSDSYNTTYRLRQTFSGGGVQTYTMKNSTIYFLASDITSSDPNSWSDATAIQAHWGAEQTWAYYNEKFGRNSFNNAGAILKSYVHYSTNYVNAFWDGSRMTYGDGDLSKGYRPLVSIDICGHEITHGVTTYEANLTYSNESGALNESFSDIFGECIENYAKGSNDWMMGCDIGVDRCGAFRNMMNPNQFGDPDTYKGLYWYTGTSDNGGVHINSGVMNKWFYVLSVGESGINDNEDSYTVPGITMEKAAKIAYRNLTVYLTASSNYEAARAGALQSAADLFNGSGSPEYAATAEAWNAVGVYGPAPDTQAPSAPFLSVVSKTQTTIDLSWTASSDNVSVTGYDVYVDGNPVASQTARTYTATGLTANTPYSIYVIAKDAAGNSTQSNTISVTTDEVLADKLVAGYHFETEYIDGWVPSSSTNCVWTNNSSYVWEGSGCVLVQSKGTNAVSPTLSLAGYSQVEVKFYFTASGMEAKKSFTLSYSANDGTSWSTIATFTSAAKATGTKFVNNRFFVATVTLNSTAFSSTAKFRIQNNGSDATDQIYFDAVTITGRTNTTGTGNVVTLAPATKSASQLKSNSIAVYNPETIDIVLYPNPVANTLNIVTTEKVRSLRITAANGSLVKVVSNNEESTSIDFSTLVKGIYIVEIVTDNGSTINKIIKK